MTRVLLLIFGVWLLVGLLTMAVKAIALAVVGIAAIAALVGLHRTRPTACYAVCLVAIAAVTPNAVWPWIGIAVLVWLALEVVHAIHTRVRRPNASRLPPLEQAVLDIQLKDQRQ